MLQLSDREWAEFRVGELFTVTGSKTTSKIELEASGIGKYPYVTTKATNNAVDGLYSIATEKGNVIVIESAVNGYVTYQEMDFSASAHVEKLIPKFEMNRYSGVFIVNIIRVLTNGIYNYGHKFNQKRIKDTIIKLPITSDGLPDYQFMHDYIAEREPDYSWATQCIEPNAELSLTDREWAEFRVGDLFTFTRGKRITKKFADENPGIIPVIAGGESNNGILCYLSEECKNCRVIKDGCISVAAFGTAGCVHYHNYKCFIDDKAIALNIKDNRFDKNKYVNIFMVCTLSKLSDRYSYGRGVTVDRYSDEVISLPVKEHKG